MNIRAKVLSALRWAAAARFGAQLLSWAVTVVVIRILTPDDYGMMAMVVVVTSFLTLLNSLGLDTVLVQKKDLTRFEQRQIFTVVIAINTGIFLLLQLAAPSIAAFYNEPRLVEMTQVLSFQFLVLIFETLPQARLERDLLFKGRSIVELVTITVSSACTLTLALNGYGVWALVWGSLTWTIVRTLGLNLVSPGMVWPTLSFPGLRKSLSFGGYVTAERGLFSICSESDKFIGGKYMGAEALGIYAVAYHFASLPMQKLAGIVNAVAFPAFSHVNANSSDVGDYLIKAVRLMSIVSFPLFIGISSVAPELVLGVLGEKWSAAVLPLQLLAFVMPLRMFGTVFSPFLFGVGRPDVSASNNLIAAIALPFLFVIGAQWGSEGLSMAWVVGFPVLFAIMAVRVCTVAELELAALLGQMTRPALLSIAMFGFVAFVRSIIGPDWNPLGTLPILILSGALFYIGTFWVVDRNGFAEMRSVFKLGPSARPA